MKSYRISILCLVAFSVVYALISGTVLVLLRGGGHGEIYPFAPWALFCFAPNDETDFAVRLTAVDGQPLDSPQFFEELPHFNQHQRTIGVGIIQELGRLSSDQQSPEFDRQRRLFESNYLKHISTQTEYEIVRRRYDVLERWRTGNCESVDVVRTFAFHENSH